MSSLRSRKATGRADFCRLLQPRTFGSYLRPTVGRIELAQNLWRVIVIGLVMLTATLLASCSGPAGSSKATVSGEVTSLHCVGAVSAQRPCPEVPVENLQVVFLRSDGVAGHATTDSLGRYSVQLEPGEYDASLGFDVLKGSQHLRVTHGASIQASFLLRFPAYQSSIRPRPVSAMK